MGSGVIRERKGQCLTYSTIGFVIDAMKSILIRLAACLIFSQHLYLIEAEEEPYTLLVFGDSLSASYGMNEDDGWVTLLAKRLQTENWPYQVVNGSISGETTTGGLLRLPAMLDAYHPDLVILELGGNDGLRGLPLDTLKQNLIRMIDIIETTGGQVLLTGIQIPPNYGPRYTVPFFQLYKEIAEERQIILVPFLIEGIPQQPELMQNDGIHPKAEAQYLILDNVWPFLEPGLEHN
jgi:acyl-CoA thioesterase-1|tara:strand:- start:1944 stop:2651 length:708 start_codon:yes stop_codon:yes gene_type:complete